MTDPIVPEEFNRWARQAQPSPRWWRRVAWTVYAHADRDPVVAEYLRDADYRELVVKLAAALRQVATMRIPATVLVLLHREYLAEHRHLRPLTEPVHDGLASAIYAALTEHGVPEAAVAEVAADITGLRASVLLGAPAYRPTAPPDMVLHPWLRPRPGTAQLARSAAAVPRQRTKTTAS